MNEFDDPFTLHAKSAPSGRVDHEGREIRLLGQPILAFDTRLVSTSMPVGCRHLMLAGEYFYTLPTDVIDRVAAKVGGERFDQDLLALERRLSSICGDHSSRVGFWQHGAIAYGQLRPSAERPVPDEWARGESQNPAQVNRALKLLWERDKGPLDRFARSYCGWLLTNRQFLDEHDELLTLHAETVRRWGTSRASNFSPAGFAAELPPGTDPCEDPLWASFVEDCNQLLIRWRLSELAGPYLPVPSMPLAGGVFPMRVVEQRMQTGGVFFLPDTMPIPSRDHLRDMLDDALHSGERPDHLVEWLDIVRSDNMARNRMDPFTRHFELQHYWRLVCQRHASAIYRRKGKLHDAFGQILGVSAKQIGIDLAEIRRRLGSDLLERPWPLDEANRSPDQTDGPLDETDDRPPASARRPR